MHARSFSGPALRWIATYIAKYVNVSYGKNIGSKELWQIRTTGSLVKNFGKLKIVLHTEGQLLYSTESHLFTINWASATRMCSLISMIILHALSSHNQLLVHGKMLSLLCNLNLCVIIMEKLNPIVTTVLKAQCRCARGQYTTINKRPYVCFTIGNVKPCTIIIKSCENRHKLW